MNTRLQAQNRAAIVHKAIKRVTNLLVSPNTYVVEFSNQKYCPEKSGFQALNLFDYFGL